MIEYKIDEREYDGDPISEGIEETPISEEEKTEIIDLSEFLVTEVKESIKKLPELIREKNNAVAVIEQPTEEKHPVVAGGAVAVNSPIEYGGTNNLDNDFEFVRRNLMKLTTDGITIVEELIDLAKSSQHPNAYKELTSALKEVAAINKSILDIHEKKIDIDNKMETQGKGPDGQPSQNNTQNNVFVGTTEEVLAHFAKNGMLGITPQSQPKEVN